MKTTDMNVKKEIESVVNKLKRYREVRAIVWFGSSLAGSMKPLSDIDIAVIVENPSKKIEARIFSSYSDKVDIVNFHKVPLYMQFEILKTGKVLHVNNEAYLAKLTLTIIRDYLEMSYLYNLRSKRLL